MAVIIDASIADGANKAELNSFELIPTGDYRVSIKDLETFSRGDNNSGVKFTYSIVSGQHKGKLIFDYLSFSHDNEKVVEIAKQNLKRIFISAGLKKVETNLSVLIKKTIALEIQHSKPTKEGKVYANVKKYLANEDSSSRVPSDTTHAHNDYAEKHESVNAVDELMEGDVPW